MPTPSTRHRCASELVATRRRSRSVRRRRQRPTRTSPMSTPCSHASGPARRRPRSSAAPSEAVDEIGEPVAAAAPTRRRAAADGRRSRDRPGPAEPRARGAGRRRRARSMPGGPGEPRSSTRCWRRWPSGPSGRPRTIRTHCSTRSGATRAGRRRPRCSRRSPSLLAAWVGVTREAIDDAYGGGRVAAGGEADRGERRLRDRGRRSDRAARARTHRGRDRRRRRRRHGRTRRTHRRALSRMEEPDARERARRRAGDVVVARRVRRVAGRNRVAVDPARSRVGVPIATTTAWSRRSRVRPSRPARPILPRTRAVAACWRRPMFSAASQRTREPGQRPSSAMPPRNIRPVRVPPVPSRRRSIGIRGWLIGAAIVLVVLLLSARGLARLYTDYLWFKEVGFADTWRSLIEAKLFPAADLLGAVLRAVVRQPDRGRSAGAARAVDRPRRRDHRALPQHRRSLRGTHSLRGRRCSSRS